MACPYKYEFCLLTQARLPCCHRKWVETQGEDPTCLRLLKNVWGREVPHMCIALLIKTDVAETSCLKSPLALRKAFFVCFALLNPFLCSPVPTCSSSLLSVERTIFWGIWVVLKPSQGFQSAVISFFASREICRACFHWLRRGNVSQRLFDARAQMG